MVDCDFCGDRGLCVASPLPQFSILCECGKYFSGRADYFDLRIFRNESVELSLKCTVSDAGTYTIWSIYLLAFSLRLVFSIRSLIRYIPTRRIKPSVAKLMLVDMAATCLAMALAIQKLAWPSESVLGTSPAATVCHVLSTLVMSAVWSANQLEELRMLTNARSWGQMLRTSLGRLQVQLQSGFVLAYLGICIISLAALGLDKSLGPIASGLVAIVLTRNIGFLIWTLFLYLGATRMQQRELSTRNLLNTVPNTARPVRVMEYLSATKNKLKKQFMLAGALYIVFSLPWLWDQQYINIGLTSIVLAFSSSVGRMLLRSEQVSKNAKGSSNNNLNTTVTNSGSPMPPIDRKADIADLDAKPNAFANVEESARRTQSTQRRPEPLIIAAYAIKSAEPSY